MADMTVAGTKGSIVSLICDSGERYSHTLYNSEWLAGRKIDLGRWQRQLQTFVDSGEWPVRQPRAVREPDDSGAGLVQA
jgi:cysteine synthase A